VPYLMHFADGPGDAAETKTANKPRHPTAINVPLDFRGFPPPVHPLYVRQENTSMNDITTEITKQFGINWPFFIAQLLNFLIVVGLFALAARSILSRGRGWEVPVWLLLAFCIPVVFPIIALIHFRKSKFTRDDSPVSSGPP